MMSTNELTTKIRELRELQALIKEAQAEADIIRDAIKAHMGSREELRTGEYRVTWKVVKSSRFDAAAMKKAMPDAYAAFCKTAETRRFCLA